MATERGLGSEIDPTSGASAGIGAPERELAEALTALGHYLAAANRILIEGKTPEAEDALREVLSKSMAQYERALSAARQLHKP